MFTVSLTLHLQLDMPRNQEARVTQALVSLVGSR